MQTHHAPPRVEKLEALRRTELFGGLPEELLHKAAAHASIRRLIRGEMLYSEHEEAMGLYVVAEGELRSVREGVDGREQVLSTERSGATLAEVSVFGGGRYFSTVIADSPTVALCIPRSEIQQMCREHPELLWKVAHLLSQRLRQYAELIELLVFRNVDQRLALFLLSVIEDQALCSRRGVEVELTLTRPEIANRIGSVREMVSRSLSHLHEQRLIELRGTKVVIVPDVQALREFAGAIFPRLP